MGCFSESLYDEVWRHVQIYEECRREATEKRTEGVSFEKRYLNMCNFLHLLKATVGGDGNANRQTLLFASLFAFSQVWDYLHFVYYYRHTHVNALWLFLLSCRR